MCPELNDNLGYLLLVKVSFYSYDRGKIYQITQCTLYNNNDIAHIQRVNGMFRS